MTSRHHHASNPARPDRTESEIQNRIFERYGREPDVTLYRNNVGTARSEVVSRAHLERLASMLSQVDIRFGEGAQRAYIKQTRQLVNALLAETPRFTRFGLCEGSSDIIGIVETRNARVLRAADGLSLARFGVFVALEVKKPGKHPTKEQQLFLDLINRRGGIGRCVHSEDEAGAAIEEARSL